MKIRSLAIGAFAVASAAAACAGASQAQYYGYRAQGHYAPVYGGYAPTCTIVTKRSFVYGYGWVYRDVRVCQ